MPSDEIIDKIPPSSSPTNTDETDNITVETNKEHIDNTNKDNHDAIHPKKRVVWSQENEMIMVEWCDVAQCYKWLNSRAHSHYSYLHAWFTIPAIIFSTIGVMIGLIISGKPFGIIMSGIGVIALAGIVVNNNIVLLDTYKNLRKNGEKIKEAILRTGAQRLRPVMLTTLTTFFGLVPMAIGLNINFLDFEINFGSPSSQWWLQLSNAIVFGVMFSFILTLVITPCLILIGEKSKIFKTF